MNSKIDLEQEKDRTTAVAVYFLFHQERVYSDSSVDSISYRAFICNIVKR